MTEIIEVIERYEIGRWSGDYLGQTAVWLRLSDGEGRLLPMQGETGAMAAAAERQRADELAAENKRLQAELGRGERG